MTQVTLLGRACASRAIFGGLPKRSPVLEPQGPTSWLRKSSQSRGRDCQHAGRVRSQIQFAPR